MDIIRIFDFDSKINLQKILQDSLAEAIDIHINEFYSSKKESTSTSSIKEDVTE